MKRLYRTPIILACLLSILVFSCKEEDKSTEKEEATAQTASAEEMKKNMEKSSDLKYNPEHGEAGHRCDLPVGAPLDQANASTTPEMTSSPVRLQSATPRINPPHGEPGHDCSVAVGAELN
ncbi:hypothetical protein GCM10023115_33170 [Pontixanthobacter gangjinensis]|uniref:Uncharacterized protein n=1 Tax=Christiangramia aestuarii TaxID=1028746 RepID=A0A7K1LSG2_9FLAO|nr:hypothetical protein [Christiangramia aestuarii]MUP43733.1 hypothetical protein [Christiangramia aestuarii]